MMQVMLVMIHTLDPELHRSTISWMWDPALVINGLVVSTPPQEDVHTVTFMTAALHHTQCVVHAAGINAHALHLLLWRSAGAMIMVVLQITIHTGSVMDALLLSMVSIKSVTIGLHS